eukprot:jgi/Galph1/4763/GphlegSOOS_G3465.1
MSSSNEDIVELAEIEEPPPEFRLLQGNGIKRVYSFIRSSIHNRRKHSTTQSSRVLSENATRDNITLDNFSRDANLSEGLSSSSSGSFRESNYQSRVEPHPRRSDDYNCVEFHIPASLVSVKWAFPKTPREQQLFGGLHLVLVMLIGVFIGIFAFGVDQGIRGIHLAIYHVTQVILIERHHSFWRAICCFTIFSSGIAALASVLVVFLSPDAMGSGLISGTVAPISHLGAITGAGFSQGVNQDLHIRLNWKWFQFYRTESWKRDFASIGLGTGFSAALESPLGGMFFSIEMSNAHWHYRLAWIALLGGIIATFTMGTLTTLSKGSTLVLLEFAEYGSLVSAGMQIYTFMMHSLPFVILLGFLGGCLGGLAVAILKQLTILRKRFITTWYKKIGEVMVVCAVINIFRFLIPYWGGTCYTLNDYSVIADIPGAKSLKYRDYSRFFCAPREFNDWAALLFNPIEVVLDVSMSRLTLLPIGGLFTGVVYYFVFLMFTAGLYAPVGVFIPSFTIGGFVGRLVGKLATVAYPDTAGSEMLQGSFGVIGSAAFGSGFLRVPMTISLGLLDATQDIRAAFCSLTASVIARNVGELLSEGFFDSQVNLAGMPFLDATISEPHLFHRIRTRDVMQRQMATIHLRPKVEDVVWLLETVQHGAFPVVKDAENATTPFIAEFARTSKSMEGSSSRGNSRSKSRSSIASGGDWRQVEQVNQPAQGVIGMISRHVLLQLLKLRHYSIVDSNNGNTSSALPWLLPSQLDETWPNITEGDAERDILEHFLGGIPESLSHAVLDLEPYMNPNPFIVSEWATAADLRAGFRQMGVRHILVASSGTGNIDGICTRKDIMPSVLREVAEKKRKRNT